MAEHPARLLFGLEAPRAAAEFALFAAAWPATGLIPRGDGHGVLVLPGWLTGDAATLPLRRVLRRLGYAAYGWELGRNVGRGHEAGLRERLLAVHTITRAPVSLVGISLGGVLARSLAREHPELVRRVVTLASPFRSYERGAAGLAMPSTAIYTRGDGIVDWRDCVDVDGRESVEVRGSHCGIGHNPMALRIVTQRLAEEVTALMLDPDKQVSALMLDPDKQVSALMLDPDKQVSWSR
jgi:pimeloyl-ACP methyl ester carboxylesterase